MLLLHLSDIHFRDSEVGTPLDPNFHLRNELVRDAQEMCQQIGKQPSAILISGDIAFAAKTTEYFFALKWLDELATACGTSTANVFVVPGNHDVARDRAGKPMVQALHQQVKKTESLFLDSQLRGLLLDDDTSRELYEPLNQFNLFAQQFFCDVKAPDRTVAYRDLTLNDGSILRLAGLNSALISSQYDKESDLFVDPACFQIPRKSGVEYVTLCHHPYNWLRQGASLKSHLDDIVRIQLFGHEHTNRIELLRNSIRISASAAHPDRTEPGWEPGYNLIELEVLGTASSRALKVAAHVRVWQSNPGQFRAKMDRKKDVFSQTIQLDSWAGIPTQTTATAPNPEASAALSSLTIPELSETGSKPMDTLRNISIRFFKLTFSQKLAIAGKLALLEDEDLNQPDFERFRRVFMRARERNLIEALDQEVGAASAIAGNTP